MPKMKCPENIFLCTMQHYIGEKPKKKYCCIDCPKICMAKCIKSYDKVDICKLAKNK